MRRLRLEKENAGIQGANNITQRGIQIQTQGHKHETQANRRHSRDTQYTHYKSKSSETCDINPPRFIPLKVGGLSHRTVFIMV